MQERTIVSISTPLGRGAIAVVRMSGHESLDYALKLFHCEKLSTTEIEPRFMYFGRLQLDAESLEECLMVYFKAPFSYTGEDVVEFQVHGGVLLAQKVVEACIRQGARLAEAGEFSKRAFLNGKITLDKAEAIIGEINAESEGELKSSLQVTNGRLAEEILNLQDELKTMLAEIEVGMDYPDETEELNLKLNIFERLEKIDIKTKQTIENSKSMKYLKNGINVALVGRTNVGKSSIMNALLGENRSIVTDIQGTTRDSVSESFMYNGMKINLIDTAGIRQTDDVVESMGIEKSKKMLENADVVLFILDGSEKETEDDLKIEELLKDKTYIVVVNKSDKKRMIKKRENEIEVSALLNNNIDLLKKKIVNMVITKEIDFSAVVLANERQFEILQEAQRLIEEILKNKNSTLDVLSMQIKKLWTTFGRITGHTENEDIIDLIFSKFCLGK